MSKCGNNKILSRSNKDGVEWFEAVLRIRIRRNSIILQDPDPKYFPRTRLYCRSDPNTRVRFESIAHQHKSGIKSCRIRQQPTPRHN